MIRKRVQEEVFIGGLELKEKLGIKLNLPIKSAVWKDGFLIITTEENYEDDKEARIGRHGSVAPGFL